MESSSTKSYVLAFDTANEVIAVAVGALDRSERHIETIVSVETPAFRASNTKLIDCIDDALQQAGVVKDQLACVVCGRGPGSFTGVRICMATAKGLALGLNVPLFGVSTLDAQAYQCQAAGYRGSLVVLGDAMRKEVYPVRYLITDHGIDRFNADFVMKAAQTAEWIGSDNPVITGDALVKYEDLFSPVGTLVDNVPHYPTGAGLLACAQADWLEGRFNPDSFELGNSLTLLPVYTRLSDAEEAERLRFAGKIKSSKKNLLSGVQGGSTLQCAAVQVGVAGAIRYQPLELAWVEDVAALEEQVMGSDAWNAAQLADELPRLDRTWWAAYEVQDSAARVVMPGTAKLVGYAGGWVTDGQVQVLKIASDPNYRRLGIAQALLEHLSNDARDLGATEITLEVRVSNTGAHAFYERMGMKQEGKRPRYYSDKEDAFIYTGPLLTASSDVAGMNLRINEAARENAHQAPLAADQKLILAIESSCDETAVALVDQNGTIVSDVVASQIDFHSRFGGVVPEIASRKHIEAISGVAQECLDGARNALQNPQLNWSDLAAVSVTYAPGLVGALVVGVAFAKGLAYSHDLPLIGVNHLEGHLYANKIATADIKPPMVVSLVSGGHTMLVHVKDWGKYETLGTTLDDAVGEAFDKVAKALGLGYPGGPLISALAAEGNPKAIKFPRALMHSGDLQFSLSGLKTAVMTYLQKEQQAGNELNVPDIAASFQQAVIDVQIAKARTALEQTGAKEFCLGGGVAANLELRAAYENLCDSMGVRLTMPPLKACTDNAAMIALVALDRYKQQKFFDYTFDCKAHAPLDEAY